MSDKPVVLILEDEPNWQEALELLLGRENYEMISVDSLQAATTVLHRRIVDAAVVDINLKRGKLDNIDGMIFLKKMQQWYSEDRVHAVMLSAHATKELTREALTYPSRMVLDFFFKEDLDEDKLIGEVARAVRMSRQERPQQPVLPSSFWMVSGVTEFADAMRPEIEEEAATKDLKLLLRNLLQSALPLARELKASIESLTPLPLRGLFILCWSRKLEAALGVSVAPNGALEEIESGKHWQQMTGGTPSKLFAWSTRYFSGIVFQLSDVTLERFLSLTTPTSD